jgi:hypothetical protein
MPGPTVGIRTSYGGAGNQLVDIGREGLDLGARPDFWGDLQKITQRLRPVPRAVPASTQAAAIRQPEAPEAHERPLPAPERPEYEATYAVPVGQGPQSAGVAYQSWVPGMTFSPTNTPIATGYRRVK